VPFPRTLHRNRRQAFVQWADAVAEQHGYTDISHTPEVFGLCPDCSQADPATG